MNFSDRTTLRSSVAAGESQEMYARLDGAVGEIHASYIDRDELVQCVARTVAAARRYPVRKHKAPRPLQSLEGEQTAAEAPSERKSTRERDGVA